MIPIKPTQTEDDVILDVLFDALSREPRRRVLEALRVRNPRTTDEFVRSSPRPDGTDQDTIRLHHVHLPRLDEAGFIEWDREMGTIERGPNYDEVRPVLAILADRSDELPAAWP